MILLLCTYKEGFCKKNLKSQWFFENENFYLSVTCKNERNKNKNMPDRQKCVRFKKVLNHSNLPCPQVCVQLTEDDPPEPTAEPCTMLARQVTPAVVNAVTP